MSIKDISIQTAKRDNIEYFVQLVRIAMADDTISDSENELLHRIGKKIGFNDTEIDNLIETTGKAAYIPPEKLFERFGQVYDVVGMTMADGVVDKTEIYLAGRFAANCGFKESEIPNLLAMLMRGIKRKTTEKELFEIYRLSKKTDTR